MNLKLGKHHKKSILLILSVGYGINAFHRNILNVLIEPIKYEFLLTDTQISLLTGLAFGLVYTLSSFPLAWLADRFNRVRILAFCVGFWSACILFMGLCTSTIQLFIARFGVGFGESGSAPTSQSILTDLFPENERPKAISILYMGLSVGMMLVYILAAWIAQKYGWRTACIILAVPGILFSLLIYSMLPEPVRGGDKNKKVKTYSIRQTIRHLTSMKSYLFFLSGNALFAIAMWGMIVWITPYFMRIHNYSLTQIGLIMGFVFGIAGIIGLFISGYLTTMLVKKNKIWYAYFPIVCAFLTLCSFLSVFFLENKVLVILFFSLHLMCINALFTPAEAYFLAIAKPTMLGLVSAISYATWNLIGLTLGPLFVGLISDFLNPRYGIYSLKYGLIAVGSFYGLSIISYFLSSRYMKEDYRFSQQDLEII